MKRPLIYCLLVVLGSACQKTDLGLTNTLAVSQSAAPATIVIIGASTAEGKGADPIDSAWVNRLRLTTAANPRPLTYVNLAKGGYTTYQGMPTGFSKPDRPAPDTARNVSKALSLHPDLVMITFPSNDIANGYASSEVISNYATITHVLDSAHVPYILFGTQPRNFSDSTRRIALKQLSTQIATSYGVNANDYFDQLSTADYMIQPALSFGDGIHVNNKGHYIVMQSVLNHPVFQGIINQ
jgi:lysophospholipase L1-like esterase